MRAVAQPKPAVARPVSASDVVGKQLGAAGGSVDQSLVKTVLNVADLSPAETPHPNGYTRAVPGRDLLAAQPLFGRLKGVRQRGLFRSNLQFFVRHVEAENIVPVRGAQNCGIHDYAPFSASNSHGRKCSGSLRLRTQPSRQQMEQRCTDSRRAMPQSRTQAAAPSRHTVHSAHRISSRRRWLELASPTRFALNPDVAHVIEHGYRPSNNT